MKKIVNYILTGLICTGCLSCTKPFKANLTTVATNFLAVDGPVVSGDSTIITLSRTTSLSDATQQKVELKAIVSVENDQGLLYPLTEKGNGVYTLGVTNFSTARQYRLDIKTTDGKVYQSDFVPMKVTPPIDSLYFNQTSDKTVLFYANTHDPTNSTRYYRWDYKETWLYMAIFPSYYEYSGGAIIPIPLNSPTQVSNCYQFDSSNQIIIGSSAKLSQDIITGQQIGGLAYTSPKILYIYVMQLRQYALTQDGFNYYQNLKTNTEQLGTLFDAQPSTTMGNIHCITSPTDLVLGFVSVSTATSKQYNLHYNDIPLRYMPPATDTSTCVPYQLLFAPAATYNTRLIKALSTGDSLVYNTIYDPGSAIPGYNYAPKRCVDCRAQGGTNIRPSYFPAN